MKELENVIDFYLKSDTNHALMITGDWGVGKTYYFKNSLQTKISLTPTYKDAQKNYRPILVSLFGLKSIEEVQSAIFLELFPILKNKKIKLGTSIGKALIKGILSLKKLGEEYEIISDIDIDKNNFINFHELVLCFDDLERASLNLRIEELIGYINSLVENENVKVLIIANENKIEDIRYKLIKEKVVGNSIEFINDLESTYDDLTNSKFKSSKSYLTYLTENKKYVIDLFSLGTKNLRILSFALTYFQTIYSECILNLPNENVLCKKQGEILLNLLKFSLIISTEYKEGRITFLQKNKLDSYAGLDQLNLNLHNIIPDAFSDKKISPEVRYRTDIIQKYYSGETYQYFDSIYNFITGGSSFKFNVLVDELKSLYHVEKGEILPQYEVFNQLRAPFQDQISDREYLTLLKEMLKYGDDGYYEMPYYLSLFIIALRFGNPLRFNVKKLEYRIIRGINKSQYFNNYTDRMHHFVELASDTDYKENLFRIRSSILSSNDQILEKIKIRDLLKFESKCFDDFPSFKTDLFDSNKQYSLMPIFKDFSAYKFYIFFIKSNNSVKWQIIELFKNRYSEYPPQALNPDSIFIDGLNKRIISKINKLPKHGPTFFLFNELSLTLSAILTRLNKQDQE